MHLKKDVFFMTSLRCLNHISKKMTNLWCLCEVWKISPANISDFSKIPHKNGFAWFLLVIEISDKIDVEPFKTLRNETFSGRVHSYKSGLSWLWADIYLVFISVQWSTNHLTVLMSQRSSKPNSRCTIYFF